MRRFFLILFLCAGCANALTIPERGTYTPSLGAFECGGYPFSVRVEEALGPHGGTIRIQDGRREVRFDLEEFNPVIEKASLKAVRTALYEGYLAQNTMAMLRRVSTDAELLEAKELVLEKPDGLAGLPVYQSAVLMSKQGGVRGQIQYSDGRFMYTMSNFVRVKEDWSKDMQLKAAYEQLLIGLSWCRFPVQE